MFSLVLVFFLLLSGLDPEQVPRKTIGQPVLDPDEAHVMKHAKTGYHTMNFAGALTSSDTTLPF